MNREFVTYEQALALKELGFNEPCFAEYRQWDGNPVWLQKYQDLDGSSTDPADYSYTTEALAPLYQQAFRWFREKHGLYGFVDPVYDFSAYSVTVVKIGQTGHYRGLECYTYEEAESVCLDKLIELVKQKDKPSLN